jgi:hypothetical protein
LSLSWFRDSLGTVNDVGDRGGFEPHLVRDLVDAPLRAVLSYSVFLEVAEIFEALANKAVALVY